MSRHSVYSLKSAADYREQRQTEAVVKSIIRRNVPQALSMEEIREATDQTLTMVMDIVQNGGQETRYNRGDLKPFKLVHSELSVANGILLRGSRILVSKSLRQKVVYTSHEGHQGIVKTKQLLRSPICFPRMGCMVEATTRGCLPCQASTQEKHTELLLMTESPERPWQ